jgi:uncharacterized RDD family membrane protein YckC
MTDHGATQGVYYDVRDYAGLFRRVIIMCADIFVLLLFWIVLAAIWFIIYPEREHLPIASFWVGLASAYLYLTIIKSSVGTLGYLITGVRIVDLSGKRPSMFKMTVRFLWLFVLPFSLILDIIWLTGEQTRQTLRDRSVGTYVVRKKAVPVGAGPQQIQILSLLGLCLWLREVKRVPDVPSELEESAS